MKTKKNGKLKISELAELSGVSVPTIKYYIREGLIPRPTSDGRKVSNYDPDCVDRIVLIKKLQKERYLPLTVIKKLISTDKPVPMEDMMGTTAGISEATETGLKTQNGKSPTYSKKKLKRLETEGLIQNLGSTRENDYNSIDSQIISLVKQREDVGLPFEYTLKVLGIYQKHFQRAVHEDVKNFLKFMTENGDENDLFTYITEGEKSAATYFKLVHTKLARMNIEKILKAHDLFSLHIVEALNFRRLEETGLSFSNSDTHVEYGLPLWSMLQKALENPGKKKSARGKGSNSLSVDISRIIDGVLDLQEGKTDEALASFDSVSSSQPATPLALALSGLTHIMKTSQTEGMLFFIRELKNAIRCFNASQKPSPSPMVNVLTTYFRLVGFAIRPNIFDIQADVLGEYNQLELNLKELMKGEGYLEDTVIKLFRQELILKSSYFLVLMYQACEEFEKAGELLQQMIKLGKESFYAGWALKKKKEIQDVTF